MTFQITGEIFQASEFWWTLSCTCVPRMSGILPWLYHCRLQHYFQSAPEWYLCFQNLRGLLMLFWISFVFISKQLWFDLYMNKAFLLYVDYWFNTLLFQLNSLNFISEEETGNEDSDDVSIEIRHDILTSIVFFQDNFINFKCLYSKTYEFQIQ